MDFKDYYQILGVSPEADNKEIKKVYKELAKKYHPDKNAGDKAAEEKFKEVSEAYHAIAEPANRKKYDDLRRNYQQWQKRGGSDAFDWSAWRAAPGSQAGGFSGAYTRKVNPEEFNQWFDTAGMGNEGSGFSDFFSSIFGFGDHFVQRRDGRDLEGEIWISLEEAYHGGTRRVEVGGRVLEAKIPGGVRDGSRIRLAGQGEAGVSGGRKGDLLLKINIQPHHRFTRDGDNLSVSADVDFYTAALGGEVEIPGFDGPLMLKIPPKTQNGKTFRFKGKGMPILNKDGQKGNLLAKVTITLPQNMSEEEIKKIRDVAREFQRNRT